MKTSLAAFSLSLGLFGAASVISSPAVADNILVTNDGDIWKLGEKAESPLLVEVKKGDVIEFKIASGGHGVMTLTGPGDKFPPPAPELVLACGEQADAKPNHVMREVECGASSLFGKRLTAPMKLEVVDKFQSDVNFWCIFHTGDMWGTFKLKADTPPTPTPAAAPARQ